MNKIKKIIIATGGTGGHVFPAYSLFKYFVSNRFNVELVSDERGIQFLSKFKDIKFNQINSDSPFKKNPIKIFIAIIKNIIALIRSFQLLVKLKPDIVFGMGGYSSFPICLAAYTLRIPFIIYENNLYLGKTNKFLLPFAHKIFLSYKEIEGLKKKFTKKVVLTGNILRQEIYHFSKDNSFKKKENLGILVLGGSQAAKIFAEKLPNIFKKCKDENIKLKILQQCLPSQNEELTNFYKSISIDCEIFNFNLNLLKYFSKVDLAITRSGSSMIAELINCKIPFISIPLPTSADNHQLKNATYFEKKQLGFLIEEKDIDEKLFSLINLIHKDKDLLEKIKTEQEKNSDKKVFTIIEKEMREFFDE